MHKLNVEQDQDTKQFRVVVSHPNANVTVTSSPWFKTRDEAITFAKANFAHLGDVEKLK